MDLDDEYFSNVFIYGIFIDYKNNNNNKPYRVSYQLIKKNLTYDYCVKIIDIDNARVKIIDIDNGDTKATNVTNDKYLVDFVRKMKINGKNLAEIYAYDVIFPGSYTYKGINIDINCTQINHFDKIAKLFSTINGNIKDLKLNKIETTDTNLIKYSIDGSCLYVGNKEEDRYLLTNHYEKYLL